MTSNEVVLHVLKVLQELEIPYMVVGSYSSNTYGRARSTQDADIVVQLGSHSIAEIAMALGAEFRVDPQAVIEFNTFTTRYIAQHCVSAFKIELFVLSDDPYDQVRFQRRVVVDFLGTQAWLPQAEDVVIWKLRWARQKDREDAFMVLATQRARIDIDYMRRWCTEQGSVPLLEQMLSAIAESEPA